MPSSAQLRLAALLLGSLVTLSTAQLDPDCSGTQRCGLTWRDANRTCKKACPNNTSEECAGLGNCWSQLTPCTTCDPPTSTPTPSPSPTPATPPTDCSGTQRCGLTWRDANRSCKKACPNNTSEECAGLGNCFSELTPCTTCGGTTPKPPPPMTTTPTPSTDPNAAHFPPGILDKLTALTGLNSLQLGNILGMIQGPEQSRPEWWLTYKGKPIWGYAENIGDGRGVTIGLYGATTGKGYNDADQIWLNYYGNTNAGTKTVAQIISLVGSLANDPRWQTAMFDAYITTYWNWVANRVSQLGFRSALTFGALLDTAMNAGIGDDDAAHWGVAHCVSAALSAGGGTEAQFLQLFLQYRTMYPTKNSGNMGARIQAWTRLLNDGQWSMTASGLLANYIYIPK